LILGGRAINQLKMDKTIVFCWIPSHVNIRSNERADDAAKSALTSPITDMKFPASELIPYTSTSSVWMSGRIYGTAAGVINSMLFILLLVLHYRAE